jgi:ATP-binding cassette subfamily C protein LapB
LPISTAGLTLQLAERAAARLGLTTKLQKLPLSQIDAHTLPVIVMLDEGQACVLLGWDTATGRARVLLPESGQGSVHWPRAELEARYSGMVLFVRPHFRFDARAPEDSTPRRGHWFWASVFKQRLVYRDVLWAALLVNLFAMALPLFTMNVYDRVVPNRATETLWALSAGVVLVLCADLFMRLLRGRFVDEASARIDVEISATLMEKVLGIRLEHRPESVGSFASTLRGFEQVRDFIASSTVATLIDLPFGLIFIGVLPILLGVSMWMQQKLNPAPTDAVQQQVFAWMPWIFMFMLGSFSSGLVVYWITNNTITFVQQYLIMRSHGHTPDIFGNIRSSFAKKPADPPAVTKKK